MTAAAAVGLWSFAHREFRVLVLNEGNLRLEPGLLMLATHRASGDVPAVCGSLFFSARVWAERRWRFHIVAREEFFERGFLAGYPSHMPLRLRRLLYPVSFAGGLSMVGAYPLRSGGRMRLAQAIAQLPADSPLDEILPQAFMEQLRSRALRLRIAAPSTAGGMLRGEFADLLWQMVSHDDLGGRECDELWLRRRSRSHRDLQALAELLRTRQPLLMFPEGRHSPHGDIGPLGKGLSVLVEKGSPDRIAYIALAYDPLTRGRPRLLVSFGAPRARPWRDIDGEVLHELKRAMPLTCGQVVAHALFRAASRGQSAIDRASLQHRLIAAAQVASQLGRQVDPALSEPRRLARRLDDCMHALALRHGVTVEGGRLVFESRRIRDDAVLSRLAREYASARDIVMPAPHPVAEERHAPARRAA